MKLSKKTIQQISKLSAVAMPDAKIFQLPEKVLQFGTGVFIRGLIDYLIDKANKSGKFNGRVIAVKSTDAGDINTFNHQDCLYTLVMRGIENNVKREEITVCSSVSRVLSAKEDWEAILQTAHNPELEIIISNTTEVGIVLVGNEDIQNNPPASYPGKLLRFLLERYRAFVGNKNKGMVIIPTELITDNATKLKAILNDLALSNKLDPDFITWMNGSNDFCNSLVDRIVPGKPPAAAYAALQTQLGYEDDLLVMGETFALWAIESERAKTKELLSFSAIHPQVFIVPNIERFRELKLRLLNGSHNFTCAVGVIAGFQMVRDAMADETFYRYIKRLILDEIAPAIISSSISIEDAREFGSSVLNRYCNQHIAFYWQDICVQDTAKIRIRGIPIVIQHYDKYGFVPEGICLSIASYILYMKSRLVDGHYIGAANGKEYHIVDDFAPLLFEKWNTLTGSTLVNAVVADQRLWATDLSGLRGFPERVLLYLERLMNIGFSKTFETLENESNGEQN